MVILTAGLAPPGHVIIVQMCHKSSGPGLRRA
jgi:hypothetical protein